MKQSWGCKEKAVTYKLMDLNEKSYLHKKLLEVLLHSQEDFWTFGAIGFTGVLAFYGIKPAINT